MPDEVTQCVEWLDSLSAHAHECMDKKSVRVLYGILMRWYAKLAFEGMAE